MESSHHGAPSSLVIAPSPSASSYKSPIRPKGHYRSSSLENNPFVSIGGKSALSLVQTNFTGTLKSRREQKRISDFLSKQSLSAATVIGSATSGNSGNSRDQSESSIRKAHFENIREIFEKNNNKNAQYGKVTASNVTNAVKLSGLAGVSSTPGQEPPAVTGNSLLSEDDKPPRIQSCSGILGKGKQVIRPIAFKPVPYKCNTPNFASSTGGSSGRLADLGERYGSTPTLGPSMSVQYKFGSTTDLHHHNHHHHQHHHHNHNGGGGNATPTNSAVSMPTPGINYPHHHQYGTLQRKNSSIPFKTYDSLESILKLPDSMIASYPNSSMR
ncbi:dual specificity protein kinase pyk3-like [Toxorhynchites rutilus septentrionalis]|uniref:dual specificity protein kinase pyk3-like n=1 Tax=Toxorhynchites rutilus septentrionalis TaxID=329112 RepID=UPI00247850DE|nr:dual specificity protein kinase pyk3-like [Toxorhynchites rutilus septentrionalis]XP_055617355.1 dual specificity protein kinase pyk3-like [Toxorhynchites rutilus septentrionalis]XP_055617356.1 dual specificity protein kinase pyk3-like [Toxorhynchites rutilus septentrionalis]XP_055617357.1 dual specificity protein kinase pyk3-like [Toxorhynchites rutilus septentrionalis]XP_055617358.1 dual specificity protein kinase pyk3-like [Toxorhynchites rutilus septentrionalis]